MTEIIKPKLHSGHMEFAIAVLVGWRQNIIVPNISWGLGLNHEADLLVLDASNRLTEIEIKISKSDLVADFKKGHSHESAMISRLVYALPLDLLESCMPMIPRHSGIITVEWNQWAKTYVAKWYRVPKHNKLKRKPSDAEIKKLMQLGLMRIWTLKRKLLNQSK